MSLVNHRTSRWPTPRGPEDRQSLELQLAKYEQEMAILEPQLADLRHRVLEIKLRLSHARLLPMDVVYEILDRWAEVEPDAPLIARCVCRQWRDATSYYTQAWRKIHISSFRMRKGAWHKVAMWVQNARRALLDVTIHWTSQEQQRLTGDGVAYGGADKWLMEDAVEEACESSYSWRRLSIRFDTWQVLDGLFGLFVFNHSAREPLVRLEDLSIETVGHNPFTMELVEKTWLFGVIPNIRSFTCLGIRPHPAPFFARLRSLTLGRFHYDTVASIILLIEGCSALEELSLIEQQVVLDDDEEPIMLTHNSLRRLRILDYTYSEGDLINNLLPRLVLPKLSQLQMGTFGEHGTWYANENADATEPGSTITGDTVLDFIKRSNPPLEALQLVGIPMSDVQLFECLFRMHRLRQLEIKASSVGADVFWALVLVDPAPGQVAGILCPKLECLHLVGCHEAPGDAILALAQSRSRLNGRWTSNETTEEHRMRGTRPLRTLHVHACPKVDGYARSIDAALPNGGFIFTESEAIVFTGSPKRYRLSVVPPEWDEMLAGQK
ncbi:hypothetical protein BV22DRAFT_1124969 [Leucogyrophana mollusca]|uniref:Uncharacterized protein n=1 Tax=Leucogyrophana mollusca TaxID=85980 RepID=A0ACB8BWX7_9AGAM|nr:hypothetical protein BV22DRAFT_1124969 [Leucogyrophana mollusca]